jgi:hypothetical protein
VNVWLWDAGKWCGIANSDRAAVAAAAACLAGGGASTARVEAASIAFDAHLQPAYARLGTGWTATVRDDGARRWEALGEPPEPDFHPDESLLGKARP